MNLILASSRLFTHAELRLSTLMRECTAIMYTLTEYETLMLGSKHPTVFFYGSQTNYIFFFTKIESKPSSLQISINFNEIPKPTYSLDGRKKSCITRYAK